MVSPPAELDRRRVIRGPSQPDPKRKEASGGAEFRLAPVKAGRFPGQPVGDPPARCLGRYHPREFARQRRRARRLKKTFRPPARNRSQSGWSGVSVTLAKHLDAEPNLHAVPKVAPPAETEADRRPHAARNNAFPGFPPEDAPQDVAGERHSAEPPDPSAARVTRDLPSLGASAERRYDRVKISTAPRMPTARSGSMPEGAIRQLPPGTNGCEPANPQLPPGTLVGTRPAIVPPSGPAPRPGPRSISTKTVLGRTTCGRDAPDRARFNTLLPRNRLIEMFGLRRHPWNRPRVPRRTHCLSESPRTAQHPPRPLHLHPDLASGEPEPLSRDLTERCIAHNQCPRILIRCL